MTDKLTRDEVNRYIHEKILSLPTRHRLSQGGSYCVNCSKAHADPKDECRGVRIASYCSDDSPRSLLNEVVAAVIDMGGKPGSQWRNAPASNTLCRILREILRCESENDVGWLFLTATAEQIARACVEAWEAREDGK